MYQSEWKDVLAFRHKTELLDKPFNAYLVDLWAWFMCSLRFTVCDICESLKSQLHDPHVPLPQKLGNAATYRDHLQAQYQDRSVCWQLCDISNAREGDVLVCWLDAMEQAKFAIPRCRGLRTSSATSVTEVFCLRQSTFQMWLFLTSARSKLQKPRMKLHGAWFFGYCLDLHCIDETNKHDAACIIEVISQGVQRVTCWCLLYFNFQSLSFANQLANLHSFFLPMRVKQSYVQTKAFDICAERGVAAPQHLICIEPRLVLHAFGVLQ